MLIPHRTVVDILLEQKVIEKINGRLIPNEKYIRKNWFIVNIIQFKKDKHLFSVPKVRITDKGFYECISIINSNLFLEFKSLDLHKDISIFCMNHINKYKVKRTKEIEENSITSIYSSEEIILKYDKNNSIIWLPKFKN